MRADTHSMGRLSESDCGQLQLSVDQTEARNAKSGTAFEVSDQGTQTLAELIYEEQASTPGVGVRSVVCTCEKLGTLVSFGELQLKEGIARLQREQWPRQI